MSSYPRNLFKNWNEEFSSNFEVPFCFTHNDISFRQWSVKFELYRQQKNRLLESYNKALLQVEISESAKKRLESQTAAVKTQLGEVEILLNSFKFTKSQHDIHLSLQQRIASTQHIESYFKNIFRDWAWGETENNTYRNILKKIRNTSGSSLIIGGGAGRLAFDLAELHSTIQILQLDINPLLSTVARRICAGSIVKLTEIAAIGYDLNLLSINHELKAPSELSNPERLAFVVGDITENPLNDHSFDTVICPWVIDIVAEDFTNLSRRLNTVLKKGGELIIFGPLSFENQKAQFKFTHQEIDEVLVDAGFKLDSKEFIETEYLKSPLDAQTRIEKIVVIRAIAEKSAKKPKALSHFPDWMINKDQQLKPDVNTINLQAQKNLEAQFLATILSGKTINQMVEMLANSNAGYNKQQAEDFILSVFARLVETKEIDF